MKTTILALALTGLLTSTALAQSVSEKTGVNSALGIAPKTEDFIKEAAMSDMLEIEAAKVAQQKGNADEKKFAEADDYRSYEDQQRAEGNGPRRDDLRHPDVTR
jgi:putative membrane protein